MKSYLGIVIGIFCFSILSFSQIRPYIPPIYHNGEGIYSDYPCGDNWINGNPDNDYVASKSVLDDPSTMMSYYDMQTNASMSGQRLYYWPSDNTMAAVAMWAKGAYSFADRGTGYNYYDGNQWGVAPLARVESVRTGWPSIQPYGINGECILTHQGAKLPLVFSYRNTKGSGVWTETYLPNAQNEPGMLWPRMVTSSANHMVVNIIAMTPSTANQGYVYNGMDGALLYIRSTDGGTTWEEWQQLPGMTSSEYLAFFSDIYGWAQPQGDTICFVVSDELMDAFIMKSTDNGTTWVKTIIYNSPYNLTGASKSSPGWFYCPDGTNSIALDNNGMAHVTFALGCDKLDGYSVYHQRWTNGIVYWNESMPMLRQDLDPDSLFTINQLIGWVTDTMVFHQPANIRVGGYHGAITGTPTMAIDNNNHLFVVWMSPTTVLDPDDYMLMHLFERTATIYPGNDVYWHDSIIDITGSSVYTFKECVFPSLSPIMSADRFHVLFQCDGLAGAYIINQTSSLACYDGQYDITDNDMIMMSPLKSEVGVGVGKKKVEMPVFSVSDPFPNPCHENTTILTNLNRSGNLSLEIINITGQRIYTDDKGLCPAGNYRFCIDASQFSPGIYFYTVKLDSEKITKKMVVE